MSLKLCYIWVSEFRNFKNTGFNFSSSEKFHYNENSNVLTCDRLEKLPEKFFGSSIIEVSALIGRNGSGKSNALELVCKLLKGGKTSIKGDFFIITEENGELICYSSMEYGWRIVSDFLINQKDYDKSIDPLKIVYFSNVFDERINNFDKDVSDISYNNRYRLMRLISRKATDFEKQIQFINSGLFEELSIETPVKFQIISKAWGNQRYSVGQSMRQFGDFYEQFLSFSTFLKNRLKEIKPESKFYYLLVYSFFVESFRAFSAFSSEKDFFINNNPITSNYRDDRTEAIIENIFLWMENLRENIPNFYDIKLKRDIDLFKSQVDFLKEIKLFKDDLNLEYGQEGSRNRNIEYYNFYFREKRESIIIRNLGLFDQSRMFDINWLGISSGHKAYLNIFSLLHYELKRLKRENLLLCIDEGDLYLHPQWQIEFFYKLIKVIPQIYKGKIQIILTSHSPFLLSDLPKQSITIVAPNENESAINGNTLETETFAGNIYALYSEPFFLGNQRMSLFAKKKIDGIISKLDANDKTPDFFPKDEIEKSISLIGDKVIRFHLMKRLNND